MNLPNVPIVFAAVVCVATLALILKGMLLTAEPLRQGFLAAFWVMAAGLILKDRTATGGSPR